MGEYNGTCEVRKDQRNLEVNNSLCFYVTRTFLIKIISVKLDSLNQ